MAFPKIKSNESVSFRPGGFTVSQGRSRSSAGTTGGGSRPSYQQVKPELMYSPAQQQARDYLSESLSRGPQAVQAETAANPFADQLQQQAQAYGQRDINPLYGQAQDVVSQTLTGGFDPTSSQYYQGFREQQDLNLADALNRYGREQFLGGGLRSTTTDVGQARLIAENQAARNTLMGQLAMQERQNQLAAVGQAQSLGQAQDQFARGKIDVLSEIGGQLQGDQQAVLDRQRAEQLRQMQQQNDLAQLLFTEQAPWAFPQYQEVQGGGRPAGVPADWVRVGNQWTPAR